MSMSTFGLIAHTLLPSGTNPEQSTTVEKAPQTVTGNSYLIFTPKNYGDNEMHWFWMVLVCILLLFAWWKLRKICKCSGPSKFKFKFKFKFIPIAGNVTYKNTAIHYKGLAGSSVSSLLDSSQSSNYYGDFLLYTGRIW